MQIPEQSDQDRRESGDAPRFSSDEPNECPDCDGFGRVWNNADPTSGQSHLCELCLERSGVKPPGAPDMQSALSNSLAALAAVYAWVDRVEEAGGPTCISGVAACNAMIKSLAGNRARFQRLIVDPGNAALAKARGETL